ncbi:MAG TPA: hypothetical protein ENJ09_10805 [Planctomycetes bacterium]|nr:hypothetical protein [Planctomycetota bacterium]
MVRGSSFGEWAESLAELLAGVRRATRDLLRASSAAADPAPIDRPVGRGAGDWTFGLDLPSERWIDAWLDERSSEGPISLLTEDRGWRHRGPDGELEGFDHGGPRIAIDPVDGTRNLMADLRSAWTVVSFAPAGPGPPRLSDLTGGILSEIPPPSCERVRALWASEGVCTLEERSGDRTTRVPLRADGDDRADHGYFPFFRFDPTLRPDLALLEARFFARLAHHEGSELDSIFDDQYISNAGQLFLTATGTYRMVVDARALVARRAGRATTTSKPYDVAGAILCARAAGVELTAADGSELDFPIDAVTPVDFVAYANAPTRARLEPHWLSVLGSCDRA